MEQLISKNLEEIRRVLDMFIQPENVVLIDKAATLIAGTLQAGGKVISCGNGGSLCDATHFAEELTGRYRNDRRPYPAVAINDPAYITCVGNDYAFDEIFSRYVEAVGKTGDVLLAISTSGASANVVRAAEKARLLGIRVISLTQEGTHPLAGLSDIVLASPHTAYSDRIQEIHIKIIHILIQVIEARMEYLNG